MLNISLMDRCPSANIFLLKAAWAALDCSVWEQWVGEPGWEPFEISEKHDFTNHGSRERGSWFYNT